MEKEEVLLQYDGLIYKLSYKYLHVIKDLELEDIVQECRTHVANKLEQYNPNKSALSTYITIICTHKLQNMSRRSKMSIPYDEVSMEILFWEIAKEYSPNEKKTLEMAYLVAREHNETKIILKILQYNNQSEVAKEMGVSRQRISKIWNDYIREVKEKLKGVE